MDNIVLQSATILQDEMERYYMYEHHDGELLQNEYQDGALLQNKHQDGAVIQNDHHNVTLQQNEHHNGALLQKEHHNGALLQIWTSPWSVTCRQCTTSMYCYMLVFACSFPFLSGLCSGVCC